MATKAAMRLPIAPSRAAFALISTARRTISTSPRPSIANARVTVQPAFSRSILQQQFRRSYAETVSPKTKRRGRTILRWIWRATYLSALGGVGWLTYNIYTLRTPQEQFEPDPSKRTLVILGTYASSATREPPTHHHRYRLGRCISPEETRHRKLQCHRYLPPQLLPLHASTAVMYDGYNRAPIDHGARPKYSATQEGCGEVL